MQLTTLSDETWEPKEARRRNVLVLVLPQVDDGGLLDHPSFYDYQIGEKEAHKDGLDRRWRLRGSVGSFLRWLTLCASGNAIGFFRSCLLPGDCHSLGSKIVLQFMLCCRLVGIAQERFVLVSFE